MRADGPSSIQRVLIVEDDPLLLAALARSFRDRVASVSTATGVFDGLSAARASKPDLVVLDLGLGDRSGLELLEDLRVDLPDARVVVLTGLATVSSAVAAMKLGACDCLEKPASVDELMAAATQKDARRSRVATLHETEREHVLRVVAECDGNISEAARRLGLPRRSLQRKLSKLR